MHDMPEQADSCYSVTVPPASTASPTMPTGLIDADTLKLADGVPAFSSVESHELAESLWGDVLRFLNNQMMGCYKVVITFPLSL